MCISLFHWSVFVSAVRVSDHFIIQVMVFSTKSFLVYICLCLALKGVKASVSFRWCVLSTEKAKCDEFIKYVNVTAQNLTLDVNASCVEGSSSDDCIAKIKNNQADLVTLDAKSVFNAGTKSSLVPIVYEQYGQSALKYYAIAVVKKNNTGINIKNLKGKKSCHTGIRRTAGWNVPIGYLLHAKIMPAVECENDDNDYMSASKFFSESCVPGINAAEFSNLCALCAGTGAGKCSTDSAKNKYVSHVGAFKCMAEGKGDVAFLKHTKLQDAVESGNYGTLADYELLCKDGTRKATGQIDTCNLAGKHTSAVVTRKGNTDIANIIKILTKMSDWYGDKQKDWRKFQLFNSTAYGKSDLIFSDSTSELKGIANDKQTYMDYLGENYVNIIGALQSCAGIEPPATTTDSPPAPTSGATVTSPITSVVLLLIALFSILFL